jgi:hypothetical protein
MTARLLLIVAAAIALSACARRTELPVPGIRAVDDLPPGQYYDQGLPAPHDVHVRPYTTLVPVPGSEASPSRPGQP